MGGKRPGVKVEGIGEFGFGDGGQGRGRSRGDWKWLRC